MARKKNAARLKNDKQITKEKNNRNHERMEWLKDVGAKVFATAIIVVPIGGVVWIGILSYHYITANNWDALLNGGKTILNSAIIFGAGWLTKMGIVPKDEK